MTPLTAGADSAATIFNTITPAVDEESEESFRRRILNEIRTVGGGGNATDYRTWAEEVSGVAVAYPYSTREVGVPTTPGDRTVFVEAEVDYDPDRVADEALLNEVKATIQNDPATGRERPPLGLTESQLFVLPMSESEFNVEIRGLSVDSSIEAETKSRIEDALEDYFFNVRPFITGLDFEPDRNDTISDLSISTIVQDVLNTVGGSADGIGFYQSVGEFLASYTLDPGELAKLGVVTYV
jgi:uncharacterized phage protein gp47/JayE